jgi:ABC-2 type transport system permease protein
VSGRAAVALVARREIVQRLRERSLLISTLVTLAILAAIIVVPAAIGLGGTDTFKVAVAGAEAQRLARAAQPAAHTLDARIEVVRVGDDAAVRRTVRSDEADAGITRAADAIVAHKQLHTNLGVALQEGARRLRLREPPPPPLPVRSLETVDPSSDQRQSLAFVAVLLLYTQLIAYGFWLAAGIVEEKSSRIVEVLLATIRPRELLAGKILGIGVVGLLQLTLTSIVGLLASTASGAIELKTDHAGVLVVVLVWFVLGYVLYAGIYAVAGVLVSRQEDIQSSSMPVTMILVAGYLVALPVLDDPSGTLAVVASLLPLTSPIVMPVRAVMHDAGPAQIAASLGLLVLAIALLIPLAARIYEGSILRMGKPLKLREALRTLRAAR